MRQAWGDIRGVEGLGLVGLWTQGKIIIEVLWRRSAPKFDVPMRQWVHAAIIYIYIYVPRGAVKSVQVFTGGGKRTAHLHTHDAGNKKCKQFILLIL